MNGNLILISFVALVLGAVIGFFVKNYQIVQETDKKQNRASKVLSDAERKSTELVKESQDRAIEAGVISSTAGQKRLKTGNMQSVSGRAPSIKKPTKLRRCLTMSPRNLNG
jgi:hypothetical protein